MFCAPFRYSRSYTHVHGEKTGLVELRDRNCLAFFCRPFVSSSWGKAIRCFCHHSLAVHAWGDQYKKALLVFTLSRPINLYGDRMSTSIFGDSHSFIDINTSVSMVYRERISRERRPMKRTVAKAREIKQTCESVFRDGVTRVLFSCLWGNK